MKEEEIEKIIKEFKSTVGTLKKEKPKIADAFLSFVRGVHEEGVLSTKEKELICLGISIYARCIPCVVLHRRSALEAGATRKELVETCGVTLMMGGDSLINYVSAVLDAFKKFSQSFS